MAFLALCALTLTLAGPLLVPALSGDAPYCCRSGRCCCDSRNSSTDAFHLKTTCGCARPDGTVVVFALPLGLLAPGPALSDLAPAEPLSSCPAPIPRDADLSPPDEPPRLLPIA